METFGNLVRQLPLPERKMLQKLLDPETFLWTFQSAEPEVLGAYTADLSREGRTRFQEQQIVARRELKDEDLRLAKVANARVLIIEAARLIVKFRTQKQQGTGTRKGGGRRLRR